MRRPPAIDLFGHPEPPRIELGDRRVDRRAYVGRRSPGRELGSSLPRGFDCRLEVLHRVGRARRAKTPILRGVRSCRDRVV